MSEKEYEFNLEFIGDVFIREVHGYKLKEYDFYKCLQTLVKEHFELVKEHKKVQLEAQRYFDELCECGWSDKDYQEFRNQQPYKFDDLKPNMWVWDDKKMDFYHVCEKIVNKDGTKILANETHYRLFEENRFFPITKALQYQGKEDASK